MARLLSLKAGGLKIGREINWLGSDVITPESSGDDIEFYQSAEPPLPRIRPVGSRAEHPTSPALGFTTWFPLATC